MNVINVHDISGRKQNHIYDNLFVFFHSALISTRILSSCFLLLFLNFRVCVLLGNQSVPTDCNRLIKKKKKMVTFWFSLVISILFARESISTTHFVCIIHISIQLRSFQFDFNIYLLFHLNCTIPQFHSNFK